MLGLRCNLYNADGRTRRHCVLLHLLYYILPEKAINKIKIIACCQTGTKAGCLVALCAEKLLKSFCIFYSLALTIILLQYQYFLQYTDYTLCRFNTNCFFKIKSVIFFNFFICIIYLYYFPIMLYTLFFWQILGNCTLCLFQPCLLFFKKPIFSCFL